jgi:hypothetical protein
MKFFEITLSWTNWLFGFSYGTAHIFNDYLAVLVIRLGPLGLIWQWKL